jgi:hypothetical protein
MNTTKVLIAGLTLFASVAAGQGQTNAADVPSTTPIEQGRRLDFKKTAFAYLLCLNSPNQGVVESALGHVAFMRIAYPDIDLREIQEKVFDLSLRGATKPIRAKAFMTLQVFANPSGYKDAIQSNRGNGDGLFETIASRMIP